MFNLINLDFKRAGSLHEFVNKTENKNSNAEVSHWANADWVDL